MGESHCLGGISNQITGDEGIFHTRVSHSDTIANDNRGKHNGRTACHSNAELDGIFSILPFRKIVNLSCQGLHKSATIPNGRVFENHVSFEH